MASKSLQGLEALPCAIQPLSMGSKRVMGCSTTSSQKKKTTTKTCTRAAPIEPGRQGAQASRHSFHPLPTKEWGREPHCGTQSNGRARSHHTRTSSIPHVLGFYRKQSGFTFHYIPKWKYVRELQGN